MPLIFPSVLSHSPLGSKHASPTHSHRTSPRLGPEQHHHDTSTHSLASASASATSLVRPLLAKRHHSTPNTPTLKSFHGKKHSHDHGDGHKHHKRSHSPSHLSYSQTRPVSPSSPPCPIRMSFNVESPPVILYGSPRESTGALISGLFQLDVVSEDGVKMKCVKLHVTQKLVCKKPICGTNTAKKSPHHHHHHHHHGKHHSRQHSQDACKNCSIHTMELARWDVLQHSTTLPKQTHAYPFSHLLPGSLPATTNNPVFEVEYSLNAEAVEESGKVHNIKQIIKVSRSIIQASDRNSVRVFPPTQLTGSIVLPSVVHPNATFPFEMTLQGVSASDGDDNCKEPAKSRWRMRKINWRIDEVSKMKPPSCSTHNADGEASMIEETRTVGNGEFKSGWKTDFSGKGKIEMGGIDLRTNASNVSCHIDDPTLGLSVSHVLVVELVVAEETLTAKGNGRQAVPTGAARVLRMQFNLNVTGRSGLGIAWDDEVPPTYGDIPLSPPDYDTIATLPKIEDVAPPYGSDQFVQGINDRLAMAQL